MKFFVAVAVISCFVVLIDARATRVKRLPSWLGGGDCKRVGDACDGNPNCCDDLVCYYDDGFSLFRDGECVTCISEGDICQRDKHCCSPLACIKEKLYSVDGECKRKLENGEHCHHDDDCLSANCEREYTLSFHGECSHP